MTRNTKRVLSAALAAQTAFLCGSSCFVLREYDGKVALFRENEPQPIAVYEAPSALYAADEELLRDGIRLKTAGEITRLIEDLGLE